MKLFAIQTSNGEEWSEDRSTVAFVVAADNKEQAVKLCETSAYAGLSDFYTKVIEEVVELTIELEQGAELKPHIINYFID